MKKLYFLVKIYFCSFLALAAPVSLSVDDAVSLALKNNSSVERQIITLNGLERARSHSWNSLSPSISLDATYGKIAVDALSNPVTDADPLINLSATARISLSGNLYTQMAYAKQNYELGKINFDQALKNIELSVRQSFYGLLLEKENISLQEKNLEIARRQFNNNTEKYNAGRLSQIDVLSAEVNYKGLIPAVENARITFANDTDSFKQLLGLDPSSELELTGNLDELIFLDPVSPAADVKSSSVEALEKKVAAAKASLLERRFNAYGPSFSATYSYANNDVQNSGDEYSSSITLAASIPLDGILPWSSRNDSVDSAKDSLKDLEIQLKDEIINFNIKKDSLVRSIKQSQDAVRYRQANVNLAQKTYEMTLEAYNRGTKDLLALQTSSNSMVSAQVALKNEIYSLRKNILSLENLTGVPFGTLTGEK